MNEEKPQIDPMKQINWALGLFLFCFGVIILVAVLFTETFSGAVANLVAGLLIVSIGGGMMFASRTRSGSR